MNTILFNKNYTKLPVGIKTAVLVACEPVRLQKQTEAFMFYDTEYTILGKIAKALADLFKDWIKKRDGDYFCLVLKSDTGAIFTTLRKDNSENREKYMTKFEGMPYSFDLNNKPIEMTGCLYMPRYNEKFQIIIKEG